MSSPPLASPATPKKRKAVLESPFGLEGLASDDENTPRKRLKTGTALKLNARADIHDILVAGYPSLSAERDVCVVSGMTDEEDVIEYSHVVPCTTQPATLNKCEWCWGMDYYTLNLDTRKNIQSLRVNLHRLFDRATTGWLWAPMDLDIVVKFDQSYKINTRLKPTLLYNGATKFRYRLVAAPEMSTRHISTYNSSLEPNDPDAFQRHFYPFTTLSTFELNIHPHFVIFNTGFKLEQIFGSGAVIDHAMLMNHFNILGPLYSNSTLLYSLLTCYDMYRIWKSASPPAAFLHSENQHWDDQDTGHDNLQAPSTPGNDQVFSGGGDRGAGSNSGNTGASGLGDGGSSTVDRETMPLGTDAPDDFVDTELVMPDDSISVFIGEDSDSPQVIAGEEEDHEAFFRGVDHWAEDVWAATKARDADDDDSSGSDTSSHNNTLIGGPLLSKCDELEDVMMPDIMMKIGSREIHQPPIFHSFWDSY